MRGTSITGGSAPSSANGTSTSSRQTRIRLGIAAVNRDLRSIELSDGGEIVNPYGPEATPRQFAAHVALVARIFDQAEVPWDQFPLNPQVGVVTYLEHW